MSQAEDGSPVPAPDPAAAAAPAQVHIPVLVAEVLEGLAPKPGARFFDGTVGAGGHAAAILPRLSPGGIYVGLDRDKEILAVARARLEPIAAAHGVQLVLVHGDFDAVLSLAKKHAPAGFDGILLDIGVSSMQIDRPERGFSFSQPGPLDMRMDPSQKETAADLVRSFSEEDLADLIFQYGEERMSRRIARAIVAARRMAPIRSTNELADIVTRALPGRYEGGRIHPATRTFQALRIAVNDELGMLERAVEALPDALAPGGRAAIISFHSLEDRIVKHALRDHAKEDRLEILTKKPLEAGQIELAQNRRSRSAKLRLAERPAE